jgi:predicted ABC-type ATPase
MAKSTVPRVVIFAGPNGAGKSTHADAILAALGINTFVNADYIARGLSGRNAEAVAMMAGRRVKLRVAMGGHNVPADTVRRRYARSIHNFLTLYTPLADDWTVYDNSSLTQAKMIASSTLGILNILEPTPWLKLQNQATTA